MGLSFFLMTQFVFCIDKLFVAIISFDIDRLKVAGFRDMLWIMLNAIVMLSNQNHRLRKTVFDYEIGTKTAVAPSTNMV